MKYPITPKPTVPEVLPRARDYVARPGNEMGGRLHIVLEDGNYEDRHVKFCHDQCVLDGDHEGEFLCDLLLAMSRTQRRKLARKINA